MADAFAELREELNKYQQAIQAVAEKEPRIPPGTPLVAIPAMLAELLSQVSLDGDLKVVIAAYQGTFVGAKPKMVLSYFPDGDVQLFLYVPDASHFPHAQGNGKTIEGAVADLRRHLAKQLHEIKAEAQNNLRDTRQRVTELSERVDMAVKNLLPHE
jgi:hypothetical protein